MVGVEASRYLLVVSLADASAKPHAVVVKPHDTVVANVAVRGAHRPEDEASLAVFEFEKQGRVHQADLIVEHSCLFRNLSVLARGLPSVILYNP